MPKTASLSGMSMPNWFIMFLKAVRSSPRSIASIFTPMTFTPYLSSTPALWSSQERFSADWPPRFGSRASGRSRSMISVIASNVSGSM